MINYFLKLINKLLIVKYVLKQLEKFIVFNYLSRNMGKITKTLNEYMFLFVIIFSMIALNLYLESPIEKFTDTNNIANINEYELGDEGNNDANNFFKKNNDVENSNLLSWAQFDPNKNNNLSDVEPSGSYEQKTNNNKPDIENYELDWWKWPPHTFSKDKQCRGGTKICNKLRSSEFIPSNEESYTTSIAYKTDAALKKKKNTADKFLKDKKSKEAEKKRKKKLLYN